MACISSEKFLLQDVKEVNHKPWILQKLLGLKTVSGVELHLGHLLRKRNVR